jgi:hypothetical protein
MKIEHIPEPELEFGTGRHVDIRFGLMTHGPVDYARSQNPRQIRLGLVGTTQTIEAVSEWLARCGAGIPAKKSNQPNLFPRFPGFGLDSCFHTALETEPRLQRGIPQRDLDRIFRLSNANLMVSEAVPLFASEIQYLAQNASVDVVICALPMDLLDAIQAKREEEEGYQRRPDDGDDASAAKVRLDLHHALKARAMAAGRPIQVIRPDTYDAEKRKRVKRDPSHTRQLQDDATIAWNFHTALYYKAGGTPWRLLRDPSQLTACHVGISFYQTLDTSKLQTSLAQIFNERGDGIIIRGGQADISKDDRQPHLTEAAAYELLFQALESYRHEHHNLPARVVIHKSSAFTPDEQAGFRAAVEAQRVDSVDMLWLSESYTRLYRMGAYPPLRGTFLSLDDYSHILYTRGSVDFFATYPGMYVPVPVRLRCDSVAQTPRYLATEVLALSKMNWNNTQFDRSDPITMRAAYQVGNVLKYVNEKSQIAPRYSYYM